MNYQQGDIVYVNLDPAKGSETKKTRPCAVVSNNNYNRFFNTVMVAPISSSEKYKEKKFLESPFFIEIPSEKKVYGTILLQHIRSIDSSVRTDGVVIDKLSRKQTDAISATLKEFF